MSHDLERALGDIADAAARAAERGLVGEPSVGAMLTRIATRVRRRRTAKLVGTGALALVLVGATAGAVDAGLTHRTPLPPIETPTTSPTPWPTTSPTTTGVAGLVCGASDEALTQLGLSVLEPSASTPVAGVTAPPIPDTAVDQALPTTFTIDNVAAEQMAYLTMQPRLVVVDADHVIVGWGLLEGGSRGPAEAGESTDAFMKDRLHACSTAGTPLFTSSDDGLLPPGDYGVVPLVDATPLGASSPVTVTAGPFAVTLVDTSQVTPPADPLDAYFACGQAPTVREDTLPDVAGLMLAADVPADGWSSSTWPTWSAQLTGSDERTVTGHVAVTLELVFVGSDGLVAGELVSGSFENTAFSVSSGNPVTLDGGGEYDRCDGDHLAATDTAMPAGTYTAWPFARVTVDTVTHPDGSADAAPEGDRIVVGFPTQVTFTD